MVGYVGPVHGYLSQRSDLAKEQRTLAALVATRNAYRQQLVELRRDDVLEYRARSFGMVRPGEHGYIWTPAGDSAGDGSGSGAAPTR